MLNFRKRFSPKAKDNNGYSEEKENESIKRKMNQKATPRFLSILYIAIIIFCGVLLIVLVILTSLRLQKNAELKSQADAIVEKYNIEATQHNNKADPDYAEIYFDGNVMYIPSEDVIIEYRP